MKSRVKSCVGIPMPYIHTIGSGEDGNLKGEYHNARHDAGGIRQALAVASSHIHARMPFSPFFTCVHLSSLIMKATSVGIDDF